MSAEPMREPATELDLLDAANLRRRLRVAEGGINFASNDYLGLADSDEVKAALQEAVGRHGAGAGASRLVSGTHAAHLALEETLADFKSAEAALVFSSGYAASVGTLSGLLRKGDIAILDKLCHASLVDGARLSGATLRVFPHQNMEKLASHLAWAQGQRTAETRVIVVTESVFSMDGDTAPLAEIIRLKNASDAWLLLDEAHAIGVLGRDGRGLADALGVASKVDIQLGTLSKAIGLSGGYVAARREIIDLLINQARSFIYSTALPPALAATADYVIREIFCRPAGQQLREKLWQNIASLKSHFPNPQSAILPLILGDEAVAMEASARLQAQGLWIPAIRYPTVSRGTARLRITVSAAHEPSELAALSEALNSLAR